MPKLFRRLRSLPGTTLEECKQTRRRNCCQPLGSIAQSNQSQRLVRLASFWQLGHSCLARWCSLPFFRYKDLAMLYSKRGVGKTYLCA